MPRLSIRTKKQKQVINIDSELQHLIQAGGIQQGLCHVFVLHTTAAITTADLDPGTDLDYLDAFISMIPDLDYRHPHNPEHVPDHILATLIGPDVTVPIEAGRLVLGTWQHVVLFEFDGPRERNLIVTLTRA
jgi:secondary thiamine-phosphate synthase enzyme